VPHRFLLALDAKYSELDGYPGFVRVNLLNRSGVEALMATVRPG
jgi:hypothetical protein